MNLFLMHNFRLKNLKFKHLIDDITIDLQSLENFVSMEDIRKNIIQQWIYQKFTSNKKILSKVVTINCNQICRERKEKEWK